MFGDAQEMQVGAVGQRKLKAAKVAVVGAGGIGSAVIPALAAAGVGSLTIIDCDVVEVSNLQRQTLFRERDSGYSKSDLALQLARSTVAGAGELARLSPESPAQLREDVTSPGGTTRAALDVLMANDALVTLIKQAVAAAAARSRELAS